MSARGSLRRILGRPWQEIPLPLRIFAVLSFVEVSRAAVVSWDRAWLVAFVAVFSTVVAVFVLRGSRVVWVFIVGSEVVGLLLSPWTGWSTWWGTSLGVVETALLILPSSWRFVWRTVPSEAGVALMGTSWDVDARPESDRPDGWYVDGDNPRRMRYWRSETGEWLGSGKTPRKLKHRLPVQPAHPDSGSGQTQNDLGAIQPRRRRPPPRLVRRPRRSLPYASLGRRGLRLAEPRQDPPEDPRRLGSRGAQLAVRAGRQRASGGQADFGGGDWNAIISALMCMLSSSSSPVRRFTHRS